MVEITKTSGGTSASVSGSVQLLGMIPARQQRQDGLSDQLADLRAIANKLGMYDAADAVAQMYGKLGNLRFGCHCDLEPGMKPDGCVIDEGVLSKCIYAKPNMRKEQCQYWRTIVDS